MSSQVVSEIRGDRGLVVGVLSRRIGLTRQFSVFVHLICSTRLIFTDCWIYDFSPSPELGDKFLFPRGQYEGIEDVRCVNLHRAVEPLT